MELRLKMKMISKQSICLILFAISVSAFGQTNNYIFVDSAYLYNGFHIGGTTSSIQNYSKAVDTMQNVTKTKLQREYLDTLNFLMHQVKSKKHFQQKVGPSFYATLFSEGQVYRISVIDSFGVIDLTRKRQFVFRNTPNSEIFNRFVKENFR